MLPTFGATPPPHSYIGDITGNYERISTKIFSRLFTNYVDDYYVKKIEICYPLLLGATHPHIVIQVISLTILNGFLQYFEQFV